MITVRELDRTDESWLRRYWELGRACTLGLADDPWPAWESARRSWPAENPERDLVFHGALDDGELVGGAWTGMPLGDNLHLAFFDLYVAPTARRRGAGSALLETVEGLAASRGRSTCLTSAIAVSGDDCPGLHFARARGFEQVATEECKVLDLAARPTVSESPGAADETYSLVVWQDPLPDEWMEGMCALYSSFLGEIPLDGVDLEVESFTPERIRATERRRVEQGRRVLTVAAVDGRGRVVGYTDVAVQDDRPSRAEVNGTLVAPDHRGHRLGLSLKDRLHAELEHRFPAVTTVSTYNSEVNVHMNAVNAALGFRVVQHAVDLQRRLG